MTERGDHRPRRPWAPNLPLRGLGAVTLLLIGLGGVGSPTLENAAAPVTNAATTTEPHIMIIVEENRSYGTIIGSQYAPYLNSLATTYVSATNWYAVQHTSQNDYVELLSGSNQGIPVGKPYSTTTLVDELHAKGIAWKAYVENLPYNCFKGTSPSVGLYDPFHNPFHYFTNYATTSGAWCSSANLSTEGIVPYPGTSGLVSALDASNAPDFVYLEPNNCHDMHGDNNTGSPCAGSLQRTLIKAGDTWLSKNIGTVITSPWFQANGIIIITWDESSGTDTSGCCGGIATGGHIATIVITSKNKGFGPFASIGDHYGTLAAIERAFSVTLLLNSANSINGNLSGAFG